MKAFSTRILIVILATMTAGFAQAQAQRQIDIDQQFADKLKVATVSLHALETGLSSFSESERAEVLGNFSAVITDVFSTVEQIKYVKDPRKYRDQLEDLADLMGYRLPMAIHKMDTSFFNGYMTQLFEILKEKIAEHFEKHAANAQIFAKYKNLDEAGMRALLAEYAKNDPRVGFDRSVSRQIRFGLTEMQTKARQSEKWRLLALRSFSVMATGFGVYSFTNDWSAVWGGFSLMAGVMTFVNARFPNLFQGVSQTEMLNDLATRRHSACALLLSSAAIVD